MQSPSEESSVEAQLKLVFVAVAEAAPPLVLFLRTFFVCHWEQWTLNVPPPYIYILYIYIFIYASDVEWSVERVSLPLPIPEPIHFHLQASNSQGPWALVARHPPRQPSSQGFQASGSQAPKLE